MNSSKRAEGERKMKEIQKMRIKFGEEGGGKCVINYRNFNIRGGGAGVSSYRNRI